MSALEQEIIEKFRLLDKDAKQRVRQQIEQETSAEDSLNFSVMEPMSPEDGLRWARAFRAELRTKYGERDVISSADILNEVREERLDDLMGGR